MNLEKIICALSTCERLFAIVNQMPEKHRLHVLTELEKNGLVPVAVQKQMVKLRTDLMNLKEDGFEPLVAISTAHMDPYTLGMLDDSACVKSWGVVSYPNEYGSFLAINKEFKPADVAPDCLKAIYKWALRRNIAWVKLDPDAVVVGDLTVYGEELQAA